MVDGIVTRRASRDDFPAVLELLRRALGWVDDDARFLEWKHLQNPFGESPMWVALAGARVVGFRAFLRWELVGPDGRVRHAARAVDTATDPDFEGRGIFTRLTLEALDALAGRRCGARVQHAERAQPPRLPEDGVAGGRAPARRGATHPVALRHGGGTRPGGRRGVGSSPSAVGVPVERGARRSRRASTA